jgi:hypothetical protein
LIFQAERAGSYSAKVILYSLDNLYDIRVLEIVAKTTEPISVLTLFFKGPARQELVQEIPIQNLSSADWNLAASIQGAGFSGPQSIRVPKGTTVTYNVQFTGLQEGAFEGLLVLKNTKATEDSFEYRLRGEAQEPLAEDHLTFKCEVSKVTIFLTLYHPSTLSSSSPLLHYHHHSLSLLFIITSTHYFSLSILLCLIMLGPKQGILFRPSTHTKASQPTGP